MSTKYQILTDEMERQFLSEGHIVLHDCIDAGLIEEWTAASWERVQTDPNDPTTWKESRIHLPGTIDLPAVDVAPKAWKAACDLMGGEERVQDWKIGNGFIMNFNEGIDQPWREASAASGGWHKDGDFFIHFLDSPEQGLLTLVIWSDIDHQGGGTFIACDSVGPVARYMAAHPEGVNPFQFPIGDLINQCSVFKEFTGKAGDIVLLHPYMLHAGSQNFSGKARFLTNPPVFLKEPMNFNRSNPNEFSLVEKAVLQGLGVERLDFHPTSPREFIIPERVKKQQQMLEEEARRKAEIS